MADEIKPGKYQHVKGKMYEVLGIAGNIMTARFDMLGVARHTETMQQFKVYKARNAEQTILWTDPQTLGNLVVYKALYDSPEFGPNALWLRPKAMFLDTVQKDGKPVPRFRHIDNIV